MVFVCKMWAVFVPFHDTISKIKKNTVVTRRRATINRETIFSYNHICCTNKRQNQSSENKKICASSALVDCDDMANNNWKCTHMNEPKATKKKFLKKDQMKEFYCVICW